LLLFPAASIAGPAARAAATATTTWCGRSRRTNECCQSNDQKKIFHKILRFLVLVKKLGHAFQSRRAGLLGEHAARRRNWRTLSAHSRVLIANPDPAD